jgi:hypothetical protein
LLKQYYRVRGVGKFADYLPSRHGRFVGGLAQPANVFLLHFLLVRGTLFLVFLAGLNYGDAYFTFNGRN